MCGLFVCFIGVFVMVIIAYFVSISPQIYFVSIQYNISHITLFINYGNCGVFQIHDGTKYGFISSVFVEESVCKASWTRVEDETMEKIKESTLLLYSIFCGEG